jgi:Exostosin family
MTKLVTLIWHRDIAKVHNRDWIRFLLNGVIHNEIVDLPGQICRPYSIVVEDTRSETPAIFFEKANKNRPIGLFHISDQYFSFDYRKYRNFDFVIKTHWSSVFETESLLVVPIGYHSDLPFRSDFAPASQRPLLWSFAGGLKASRYDMVQGLSGAEPNVVHATSGVTSPDPRLDKRQYLKLLEDSIFSPCAMGNVIMESWRLYESLEAGCIPVVEKRTFLRYYERLLIDPPLVFVRSWSEAKERMLTLAGDRAELDRLPRETYHWWQQFKGSLKERVTRLVTERFAAAPKSSGSGVRVKAVAEMPGWHYAELLRHQSLQSLRWRVQRNLLGGRLKVPY